MSEPEPGTEQTPPADSQRYEAPVVEDLETADGPAVASAGANSNG